MCLLKTSEKARKNNLAGFFFGLGNVFAFNFLKAKEKK
jgi:hypothetical protein